MVDCDLVWASRHDSNIGGFSHYDESICCIECLAKGLCWMEDMVDIDAKQTGPISPYTMLGASTLLVNA